MRFCLLCCAWLLHCFFATDHGSAADRAPNIVLILADDLGWSDLACYGADLHETPYLDQFARDSLRFTDAYAMPVCSPTRAALMTGKHAARVHMTIWSEGSLSGPKNRALLQADSLHSLPRTETTLATQLQAAGYLTALIGKWHLGDADHYPETHGFDVNVGGTHWGAPHTFWWPYRGSGRFGSEFRYVPHMEFGKPGEYLTDRLTDEALHVIDHAGDQPFFLYLSHHAPHTPIEAKPADVEYFQAKLTPTMHHQNAVYAAMIKSLDENVGRVLERLKQRELDKNTIVVFLSDNGGFVGIDGKSGQAVPVTNNTPLRSGKGSCYEGGLRIPLLIRWPSVTRAGTVCHEPVVVMDLFSTLLASAGLSPSPENDVDGINLRPLLTEPSVQLDRTTLFFHYPHYYATTTPVSALRSGDWKLLEYFEDQHVELYNLKEDLGESTELSQRYPEVVSKLRTKLHTWRNDLQVALPKPNPDFQPNGK